MTYTIDVTAEDIEKGQPCEPCKCPVARAMSRALGERIAVGLCEWQFDVKNSEAGTPLPIPVRHWILAFDDEEGVEPITFTVEGP